MVVTTFFYALITVINKLPTSEQVTSVPLVEAEFVAGEYIVFEFYLGFQVGVLLLALLFVTLEVAVLTDSDGSDAGLLIIIYPGSIVADFREMPADLRTGGVERRTVLATWTNEFVSFFALLSFTVAVKFCSASVAKTVTGV